MNRVILTHKEMGIYLGSALGFGFWSLLDSAYLTEAVTFPSIQAAVQHINSWDRSFPLPEFDFHVKVFDKLFASVPDLEAMGLGHLLGDMKQEYLRQIQPAGRA